MAEFLDITKNLLVSLNAYFKLQYPFIELNFCDKFAYHQCPLKILEQFFDLLKISQFRAKFVRTRLEVVTATGRQSEVRSCLVRANKRSRKWQTVGKCKRKLPARHESAVLHNPYLGCKHNVKEVPLAWQQLQFFAIYCYLTGSPHDKGN